jgi:hypothetical protein
MNLSLLEQFEQEHEGPEDPLLICPNSTWHYFVAGARVLLKWNTSHHSKQEPLMLVHKALHHLQENPPLALETMNRSLKHISEKIGISETVLRQARSVAPSKIKFHLAPELMEDMAFISEIQHNARRLYPMAQQVISGPCSRLSRVRIERIFWAIDFSFHAEERFRNLYNNKRSSLEHYRGRDSLEIGTESHWAYGTRLSSRLPNASTCQKLKPLYTKSALLLSARPWSHFARFEILKVTLTIHTVGAFTKWVMFRAKGTSDKDISLTDPSPLGEMRIFHQQNEIDIQLDAHGQGGGRMYIASKDLASVHYDTIFLLEHLFGPALFLTEDLLPNGVIPLVAVEANGTSSERSLHEEERKWLDKCLLSIAAFVKDEESACDKNSCEEVIRSYAVNREGEPSAKGSDTIVTISYNMDKGHGGLWDHQEKSIWFA